MFTSSLLLSIEDITGEVNATSPKEENLIMAIFNAISFYIERGSG